MNAPRLMGMHEGMVNVMLRFSSSEVLSESWSNASGSSFNVLVESV